MHQSTANVLLLSLAVLATTGGGLEEFDKSRFLTVRPVSSEIYQADRLSQQATDEERRNFKLENITLIQGIENDLKFDVGPLLKEIKSCRERFPDMSDRSFSFKLYDVLLSELTKAPNKAMSHAFCNISEGLVDGLRETLHELEIFQSKLMPKNNSTESPGTRESSQQTNNQERIYSNRNVVAVEVENNLKLKLGDEWIPLDHKVDHLSHIYLGNSLFPLLTEESRIIDKYHTLPGPSTTSSTLPSETQLQKDKHQPVKRSRIFEKVHHLLTPFRWHLAAQKREATRVGRSVTEDPRKDSKPEKASMKDPNWHIYSRVPQSRVRTVFAKPNYRTGGKSSIMKETRKPSVVEAKNPFYKALEFLLTSWRNEFKINKGALFD